jgi:hypothetical protein
MHLTQVNTGILFAKKNVSGRAPSEEQADHANAEYLLDLAFQSDGRAVTVIDLEIIEELARGTQTIWSLIDSGITRRRFGKPKQSAMNT